MLPTTRVNAQDNATNSFYSASNPSSKHEQKSLLSTNQLANQLSGAHLRFSSASTNNANAESMRGHSTNTHANKWGQASQTSESTQAPTHRVRPGNTMIRYGLLAATTVTALMSSRQALSYISSPKPFNNEMNTFNKNSTHHDQELTGCKIPEYFGGWHKGRIVDEITRSKGLTWRECAQACAKDDECEYWTLRIHDYKSCMLMAEKGEYHANGFHVEGDKDAPCADSSAPTIGQKIEQIFYINLPKNVLRLKQTEAMLSRQDLRNISVEKVTAIAGGVNDTCRRVVGGPNKCRGVAGLALTNLKILDEHDLNSGYTLVLEDDIHLSDIGVLMASTKKVPDDWDIIRWNCDLIMPPPSTFDYKDEYVFRTDHIKPCNVTTDKRNCRYYGGTQATLYRGSSVEALKAVWSERPFFDVDGALTNPDIKSYCIRAGHATLAHRPPAGERSDIQTP